MQPRKKMKKGETMMKLRYHDLIAYFLIAYQSLWTPKLVNFNGCFLSFIGIM
jgi:hypothetical protein